jgi:hypothetical protein
MVRLVRAGAEFVEEPYTTIAAEFCRPVFMQLLPVI